MRIQPGKLALQRHVKEGFLHRRVCQTKPLLQEIRTQHCFKRKWLSADAPLGVIRSDKYH